MADIVLIVPKYDMKRVTSGRNEEPDKDEYGFQVYPSLGLLYLASSLEQNNISVKVKDMAAEGLSQEDVIKVIKKEQPLQTVLREYKYE